MQFSQLSAWVALALATLAVAAPTGSPKAVAAIVRPSFVSLFYINSYTSVYIYTLFSPV